MRTSGFMIRKVVHLLAAVSIVLFIFPIPTQIAKAQCSPAITVANLNGSGAGSLAQALADICAGGTITFDPSLNGGTIHANITITTNLTIHGLEDPPGITLDGNHLGTVININPGSTATLTYLTVQNGSASGIINRGNLTLDHVNVTNNSATDGGGIHNIGGQLTIRYSTISGNTVSNGGGILVELAGTLTIENSTVSSNTASLGGGIYVDFGSTSMKNVTITSNTGDGFNHLTGTSNITNTIISGNSGTDCPHTHILNSYGHNMIRTLWVGCTPTDLGGGTDLNGIPGGAAGPDPLLGGLADNGGFTKTHALRSGSPAIDMGCDAAPVDDQRGVTRPLDGGTGGAVCDSGAFEAGAVLPVATGCSASGAAITGLNTIDVTFNTDMTDMASGGGAQSADNTANYLLVEKGANGRIDTQTCREGVIGDDVAQTISVAAYDDHGGAGPYTTTLTLADALDGAKGYGLFACGTSSIWSAVGLKLNNGRSDAQYNFGYFESSSGRGSIGGSEGGAAGAAGLPGTGFPPGYAGVLPVQPRGGAYTGLSLTLEIPRLKVKAAVVGVPRAGPTWDVTWLGRQAGYLEGSAFPTWDGNSVLTGHVWDADNSPGIFVDLKKLSYGDKVRIHAFGKIYTYEVREQRTLRGSQVSTVFKHEARPWLTLLTCEDYREMKGDYALRRIVRAVLTTVTPEDLWE